MDDWSAVVLFNLIRRARVARRGISGALCWRARGALSLARARNRSEMVNAAQFLQQFRCATIVGAVYGGSRSAAPVVGRPTSSRHHTTAGLDIESMVGTRARRRPDPLGEKESATRRPPQVRVGLSLCLIGRAARRPLATRIKSPISPAGNARARARSSALSSVPFRWGVLSG